MDGPNIEGQTQSQKSQYGGLPDCSHVGQEVPLFPTSLVNPSVLTEVTYCVKVNDRYP
jgi:hypothetical protein